MKGGLTSSLGCVLLVLASLLGPALFVKRWTDDVWKERELAATNLFRANQNETIVNATIWERISKTREMLKCSPSTVCSASSSSYTDEAASCPLYLTWIRQDLSPWAKTGISIDMVEAAKLEASFRLTVVNGRVDFDMHPLQVSPPDVSPSSSSLSADEWCRRLVHNPRGQNDRMRPDLSAACKAFESRTLIFLFGTRWTLSFYWPFGCRRCWKTSSPRPLKANDRMPNRILTKRHRLQTI